MNDVAAPLARHKTTPVKVGDVTVGGGAGRWIDATEDDVQPRGEEVGVVGADVELLSRKSLK